MLAENALADLGTLTVRAQRAERVTWNGPEALRLELAVRGDGVRWLSAGS